LKTYAFSVNSKTDTGTLNWNSNGTLQQLAIVDNISGTSDSQTCNYTYDDAGRIGGKDTNGYSVDCGSMVA
jgi:YD repeat-containing protein